MAEVARSHPPPRGSRALAVALAASALFHVMAALGTLRLSTPGRVPTVNRTAIEVTFMPRTRAPDSAPTTADNAPDQGAQPVRHTEPTGRLVRLPAPKTPQTPKDARHTSEFDHAVEKETRARDIKPDADPAHEVKAAEKNAATTLENPPPNAVADLGARTGRATLSASMQLQPPKLLLAQAPTQTTFFVPATSNTPTLDTPPAQDSPHVDTVESQGLGGRGFTDAESAQRGTQKLGLGSVPEGDDEGGAPVDLIEEGVEGTGVYLNALQRRHASFFNRLTDAVRRRWHPDQALRQRTQRERDSQPPKRFTLLEITLDRQGRVVAVQTDRYSGADYLDDEAARAVRAAGPFGAPPSALFEGADQFSFRFGFTIHFQRQMDMTWPMGRRSR